MKNDDTLYLVFFLLYFYKLLEINLQGNTLRESEQKSYKYDRQDSDNQRFQFNMVISELLAFIVKYCKIEIFS